MSGIAFLRLLRLGLMKRIASFFTVDGLFLFIPVIYNSLLESQSSTIGDYLILEDI